MELEVDGTKFEPNAVARFDSVSLPPFVSSTRLTATLDSQLLQEHPGGYVLYVVNPGLNGNISAPAYPGESEEVMRALQFWAASSAPACNPRCTPCALSVQS